MITIYDRKGNRRADIAADDSSTQRKEVQGDNVLALSFTHHAHIAYLVLEKLYRLYYFVLS